MRKALITGITGQDGSYLAELLLAKGYEVHGIVRRSSSFNRGRIEHLHTGSADRRHPLHLHYGDVSDGEQIRNLVQRVKPDEVYHLAAQSHVRISFDMPEFTTNVTALGTTRLLEAVRWMDPRPRFYQASSSEMFGDAPPPQNEASPFRPRSPYAAAKVYAYWMTVNYRAGYQIFATNGILFNHEAPRRGENFVTRKIAHGVAIIRAGRESALHLGNLAARRDWGYAPEYVEAMWKMLQLPQPGDYVVGTGQEHSVQEFVEEAFAYVGLDWSRHVKVDPRFLRPTETERLCADASRARRELGWTPRVRFRELVWIMMDAELRAAGLAPPGKGDAFLREQFPDRWWGAD